VWFENDCTAMMSSSQVRRVADEDDDEETRYKIVDRRTGKRVSQSTFAPIMYAHDAIVGYRNRDRRGLRPDLHELIPHLAIAVEDGL